MIEHSRSRIRHAVKEFLINKTAVGDRVYTNRFIRVKNLPAIIIYTKSETSDVFNESPKQLKRRLELVIEAVISGSYQDTSFDDKVDAFVLQIENCLNEDMALKGLVSDISLQSTDISNDEHNEIPVVVVVMNYSVIYYTDEVYAKEYEELKEINFSMINDRSRKVDGIVNMGGEHD